MGKRTKRDTPDQIAFWDDAPQDERQDAMTQLQKAHAPNLASELLPQEGVREVIDWILHDLEDQAMNKAMRSNVVPFPSIAAKQRKAGMQSVDIDDLQVIIHGDYMEKPGVIGFDMLRAMVDQTPILNAVIMTRQRQVARFCQVQESGEGPGFLIRHRDRQHEPDETERRSMELLQGFFDNCGWETNPRRRKRLKRDSMSQFMQKLVRDSLTLDSCAIETEWKRDKRLGIDGLYAVDGGTIRLCTEHGYQGDDEIFALQVVQGVVRTAYTYEDLIYEPRNPRTDVISCGYGLSETELLIKVVTGWLNAMTYNSTYFDKNTIPKGILHLSGDYSKQDLDAFKRYWNAMVKGINNAWTLPVLVSKDQESKASFDKFGVDMNEMMFSKWMTFLTSIICAIYGMSPEEINSEGFSASKSALSGSDTAEKLADSKDKGLRPLLSYFQNLFTDYIVNDFSDKYVFRWTGLDEDQEKQWETKKLAYTWNEMRSELDMEPVEGRAGTAPVNPSLMSAWQTAQQEQSGEEDDFGTPPAGGLPQGQPGGEDAEQQDDGFGRPVAGDFGQGGGEQDPDNPDDGQDEGDDKRNFGKAFTDPTAPLVFEVEP